MWLKEKVSGKVSHPWAGVLVSCLKGHLRVNSAAEQVEILQKKQKHPKNI